LHILVLVTDIFIFTLRGRQLSSILNIILTLFLVKALAERVILILILIFSSGSISANLSTIVSRSERHYIALA
jgi:predicted Abi (CAAX) family protease